MFPVCAGSDNVNDLTCKVSKAFNLDDYLSGATGLNFTWTEVTPTVPTYTTQGGTITGGGTGGVNFASIATNRTYVFRVTVDNIGPCPTLTDVADITVIHGVAPNITFGTAVNNGNGTSTYPFTYSGVVSSFAATLNSNPATFQSGIQANNGSGTMTVYNVAGLNTVVLSATSVCGVGINDTDTTLTI